MSEQWRDIATAPKDGTPIRIKGRRFISETRYTATAIWAQRKCPQFATYGWFPPTDKHDGMGPYTDVSHWMPLREPPK